MTREVRAYPEGCLPTGIAGGLAHSALTDNRGMAAVLGRLPYNRPRATGPDVALAALATRWPGTLPCLFSLMRTASPQDPDGVRRLVAANRAVYERARELGAVLHPASAVPMAPADWRTHFGRRAYEGLARAKGRYDPYRIRTRRRPRLEGAAGRLRVVPGAPRPRRRLRLRARSPFPDRPAEEPREHR